MNETQFWEIIDTSRQHARQKPRARGQDFLDVHEQTLADALRPLPPAEIIAFDHHFWEVHRQAYRWDLWAAAYWICGGCGNDGFTDFRACLISLGKDRFSQVLRDPDSLAEIVDQPDTPYMQAEGFQYIASKVYKQVTGKEMPQVTGEFAIPAKPAGEKIDAENEELMREHFPRLLQRFPEMGN